MSEKFINAETYEFIDSEDSEAINGLLDRDEVTASQVINIKGVYVAFRKVGRMIVVTGSGGTTDTINNADTVLSDTLSEELRPASGQVHIPIFNAFTNAVNLRLALYDTGEIRIRNSYGSSIDAFTQIFFNGCYDSES